MKERKNARPPLRPLLLGTGIGFFFVLLLNLMPAYLRAGDFWAELSLALGAKEYWLSVAVGFLIVLCLVWVLFPVFFRWIRCPGSEKRRSSIWRRYRAIMTAAVLLGLAGIGAGIVASTVNGGTTDWFCFLGLLAFALLAMAIYIWSMKPGDEKVEAIETGRHERLLDERYRDVQGRSAVSTIYLILPLLLAGGSLYDLLVTRLWPARTLLEVILICLVWNLQYYRWNKKI